MATKAKAAEPVIVEMSKTAERYKILYESGRVDDVALKRAVVRGLITAYEYKEITGEEYVAA